MHGCIADGRAAAASGGTLIAKQAAHVDLARGLRRVHLTHCQSDGALRGGGGARCTGSSSSHASRSIGSSRPPPLAAMATPRARESRPPLSSPDTPGCERAGNSGNGAHDRLTAAVSPGP